MKLSLAQKFFQSPKLAAIYERLREGPLARPFVGASIETEIEDAIAWIDRGVAGSGAGKGARVLDVACGQGTFTVAVARARPELAVTGVDLSGAQLALARRRAAREGVRGVDFVETDACETPFLDATFAAVVFMGGLHQIRDHRGLAREMARVAKPGATLGGAFFSMDGDASSIRRRVEEMSGLWLVDPGSWGRALEEAGFGEYVFERRTPIWGVFSCRR